MPFLRSWSLVVVGLATACGGLIESQPDAGAPDAAHPVDAAMAVDAFVVPPGDASVPPSVDASVAFTNPFQAGQHWRGTYTCPQGATDLDLQIVAAHGETIDDALFNFDWKAGGVSGSYHMSGTFDPATGTATLTPGAWVNQPSGWFSVGMTGFADAMTYSGSITTSGCGTFVVHPF